MDTHKQCYLVNNIEGFKHTAWLPTEKAIVGNYVKIKIDGEWVDHWKVVEVFEPEMPSKYVQEHSQDYKNTRKASDI